jgi:hypothetical protein
MTRQTLPPRDDIKPDSPLRLDVAAALAYPDGSMTASGLRREAARGRLVIERTAGKDYTTLADIERMRELMPRRGRGPRLWFQPARRDRNGYIDAGGWTIRDGSIKRRLGLGPDADQSALEDALADYIRAKRKIPRDRDRHPAEVMIADVVSIYAEDVAPRQERPKEVAARLGRLLDFFGTKRLDQLNAKLYAAYVAARGSVSAGRREPEDLRSAVRHHWKAGLCLSLTPVVLPVRGEARVRWLRRGEAARLLLAAYRYREVQKGFATGRRSLAHVARFILD